MIPQGCVPECPACPHREWSREESESQKLRFLSARLAQVVGPDLIESVRGPVDSRRWAYREKTCLHVRWTEAAGWCFGLLQRRPRMRDPELVAIPDCPIHSKRVRDIVRALTDSLPESGPGEFPLAFVLITGSLVTLVLKSKSRPARLPSETSLREAGVSGLLLNLNPSAGRRVLSTRAWHPVWGAAREIDLQGLKYGPDSFQQLLRELYSDALDEAESFLDPGQDDRVLDLYCGSGASLKRWQKRGVRWIGVELGGEAVECAAENLGGSARILRGRVSDRLPQLGDFLAEGGGERVVAFVNPPRTGLEREVCAWLGERARPARLVYLSCSPGTLSRDLSILCQSDYAVRRIIPYDFFPQTHHIEALAELELDRVPPLRGPVAERSLARPDG